MASREQELRLFRNRMRDEEPERPTRFPGAPPQPEPERVSRPGGDFAFAAPEELDLYTREPDLPQWERDLFESRRKKGSPYDEALLAIQRGNYDRFQEMTTDEVGESEFYSNLARRWRLVREVGKRPLGMELPKLYEDAARRAFSDIPTAVLFDLVRSPLRDEQVIEAVRATTGRAVRDALAEEVDRVGEDFLQKQSAFGGAMAIDIEGGEEELKKELRNAGISHIDAVPRAPTTVTAGLAQAFGLTDEGTLQKIAERPSQWFEENVLDTAVMEHLVTIADAPARALDWAVQQIPGQEGKTTGQFMFSPLENVSPEAYSVLSGTADAIKLFALDSFVVFGKAMKGIKLARGLENVQDISEMTRRAKQVGDIVGPTRFERAVAKVANVEDAEKFVDAAISSKPVEKFIDWYMKLPKNQRNMGFLSRAGEMYGWRVKPAAWGRLHHEAETADDVRRILKEEALGIGPSEVQNVERLPYLAWHRPVRDFMEEGAKVGGLSLDTGIGRLMRGPLRMTWGTSFDPAHPNFEKFLRRFGDHSWGVKRHSDDAARIVDNWVTRILKAPSKGDRVREMSRFAQEGLKEFGIRHGASADEVTEALKRMEEKYPHTMAKARDGVFGFREAPDGLRQINIPFRKTSLDRSVSTMSYMDVLAFRTELLNAMGRKSGRGLQAVQAVDRFLLNNVTVPIVKFWLGRGGLGVKIGLEEGTNLAGHYEVGRWYRRKLAERMMDDLSHIPLPGHPLRKYRGMSDLPTAEVDPSTMLTQQRSLHLYGEKVSDDVRRAMSGLGDEVSDVLSHIWDEALPGDEAFTGAWYHQVNRQILNDPLDTILVRYMDEPGGGMELARSWLRSPEGQRYLNDLPRIRKSRRKTVLGDVTADDVPRDAPYYHGTSQRFAGDEVDPQHIGNSGSNLLGPGFYVTSDPSVAFQYTSKGVRPGSRQAVYGLRWKGQRQPNLLDAEQPIPTEVREPFQRALDRLDEAADFIDFTVDDFEALQRGVRSGELSPAGFYRDFREMMRGVAPRYEVDDMLELLREDLVEAGYDGFRYQGGVRTGNPEHEAFVFFRPENIETQHVTAGGKKRVTQREAGPETDEEKLDRVLRWNAEDVRRNIPDELVPHAQAAMDSGGAVPMEVLERLHMRGVNPPKVTGPKPIRSTSLEDMEKMGIDPKNMDPGTFERATSAGFRLGARFADHYARTPGWKAYHDMRKAQLESLSKTRREFGAGKISDEWVNMEANRHAFREMYRFDNPTEKARGDFWLKNWVLFTYAQNSFMKRWGRMLVNNPGFVSRARKLIGVGQDMGFVEEDDEGNTVFRIPISGEFYKSLRDKMLGYTEEVDAPDHFAQLAFGLGWGANMSGTGLALAAPFETFGKVAVPPGMPFSAQMEPGFGPVGTFPVAALTATRPKLDWLRNAILGGYSRWDPDAGFWQNTFDSLAASYARTLADGVLGLSGDRRWASTTRDLVAWADFSEKDNPFAKETWKKYGKYARGWNAFKLVTQYLFPYSVASPVFMEERDRLHELIDEHGDYTVGVEKFLTEQDGKGWPLVTGLSQAAPKDPETGSLRPPKFLLAPTGHAEKFYRDNEDFFADYPDVAGLFSYRKDDEFDPQAFKKQFQRGLRLGRDPMELWLQMNIDAGVNEYFERVVPALDEMEEQGYSRSQVADARAQRKEQIDQLFPGTKEFLDGWSGRQGHRQEAIEQLKQAVDDPRVANKKGVEPLRKFLHEYERADNAARQGGNRSGLEAAGNTKSMRSQLVAYYKQLQEENEHSAILERAYRFLFQNTLEEDL